MPTVELMSPSIPTLSLRTLYNEPAVVDPPGPMRRDWALVAVLVVAGLVEGIVRDDVVWRIPSIVLFLAIIAALPWRRRHPLAITAAFFGTVGVTTALSLLVDADWEGLYSAVVVLLLPYALFRWASGRHALLGLVPMLAAATLSMFQPDITAGDIIGGYLVLLFPAVLGAEIRALSSARAQQIDQARSTEREQLARELHDSVAHYVSAIAVQAQAGQAVGPANPDAALQSLAVIEEQASRTLAEMRTIVGALRNTGDPELTPQHGVADIDRLAKNTVGLPVEVELHGELAELRPSVDSALYRLAQESITNAVRHARNASRVCVQVEGDATSVRLRVHDDGDPTGNHASTTSRSGFGLIGMTERVELLGGTVHAGPDPRRGWAVDAVLPRSAAS